MSSSPWGRYEGGLHHLAQPTVDPEATIKFYVEMLGAKITHCITAKGWKEGHYDFVHMFLNLGDGDKFSNNFAMFYYFGVEELEGTPRYGTHHSFGITPKDLDTWQEHLEANGYSVHRWEHEVFTSLYVDDPNGRILEIAADLRPLGDVDAEDANYTAEALIQAVKQEAESIDQMWNIKADLIEKREGVQVNAPALFVPAVEEFQPLLEAAEDSTVKRQDVGGYTVIEGDGELRMLRLDRLRKYELRDAIWNAFGTGGMKGKLSSRDEHEIVLSRE